MQCQVLGTIFNYPLEYTNFRLLGGRCSARCQVQCLFTLWSAQILGCWEVDAVPGAILSTFGVQQEKAVGIQCQVRF